MNNQKLQRLQQKWYRKLEKEGFKDIEDSEGRLKSWTGHALHDEFAEPLPEHHRKESSKIHKTSQQEYYRLVGQFLFDKTFPNKEYKTVWAHHAEGKSYSEICKVTGLSLRQVRYRIHQLRMKFFK